MAPQFDHVRPLGIDFPVGRDPAHVRRRIETLERLLENLVMLPGGGRKGVGLDAMIGLVPVAGDLFSAALGLYIVWEARRLGVSRWQQMRMFANIALDTTLGAIPIAGDLFDLLFRSNSRNLAIIRRHLDRHHPQLRVIEA